MPAKTLTDAFVRDVKPPRPDEALQRVYLDNLERGLSLVLVVSYGGSKTFRALTYVNGKPQSRKLGNYPAMSVKQAKGAARAFWENPAKAAAEAAPDTFQEIAQNWIKRHVVENRLRSRREFERCLRVYVYPQWGQRRFVEIRRGDVNALLDRIVDNHGRAQADVVLAIVRSLCNWYAARNEHYLSPIVAKMRRDQRPVRLRARSRWLSAEEIRAVWKAAGEAGTFGALVRFALLSGQRRTKIATMQWDDVEDGVWTIARSDEREKGTPDRLQLPALASAIIKAQPKLAGNPYIFAGRGGKAFGNFSQCMAELRAQLPKNMPAWRLHDLRRTARKLMARGGVRPDIGELALGHSIQGIRAVYDDPGEYQPLVDQAVAAVAAEVARILNPPGGKVVALPRRKGRG